MDAVAYFTLLHDGRSSQQWPERDKTWVLFSLRGSLTSSISLVQLLLGGSSGLRGGTGTGVRGLLRLHAAQLLARRVRWCFLCGTYDALPLTDADSIGQHQGDAQLHLRHGVQGITAHSAQQEQVCLNACGHDGHAHVSKCSTMWAVDGSYESYAIARDRRKLRLVTKFLSRSELRDIRSEIKAACALELHPLAKTLHGY